jgi:hypothetical protein
MIEASNALGSSIPPQLQSRPTLSNFTFIGTPTRGTTNLTGIILNSGSSGVLANGVVIGSTTCLDTTAAAGTGAFPPPAPTANSILFDCPGANGAAATAVINAGGNNSTTVPNTLSGFVNGTTENARTAVNPTTLGAFFQAGNYIGAVQSSTDRWWAGWTCGLEASTPC